MPFRIPHAYENLTVVGRDPVEGELRAYHDWLASETALVETAIRNIEADQKRRKAGKKENPQPE